MPRWKSGGRGRGAKLAGCALGGAGGMTERGRASTPDQVVHSAGALSHSPPPPRGCFRGAPKTAVLYSAGEACHLLTPASFFKTLIDTTVTVELKNDIQIRGTLKSVDQYLNIKLDEISVVDDIKYPHLVRASPPPLPLSYFAWRGSANARGDRVPSRMSSSAAAW